VKPIKMFGLAVLAALTVMAFVGASSAMAEHTQLCSADQSLCSVGNAVSHVHEMSAGPAKILSVPTVECYILFLGDSLGLANPLIIHGTFTYTTCNNACTITEENGPALVEVLREGTELALVAYELLIHINCFIFINCRYKFTGVIGHALGPLTSSQLNGSTVVSGQELQPESGSCPEETFLDVTFLPLTHAYISS